MWQHSQGAPGTSEASGGRLALSCNLHWSKFHPVNDKKKILVMYIHMSIMIDSIKIDALYM